VSSAIIDQVLLVLQRLARCTRLFEAGAMCISVTLKYSMRNKELLVLLDFILTLLMLLEIMRWFGQIPDYPQNHQKRQNKIQKHQKKIQKHQKRQNKIRKNQKSFVSYGLFSP